MITVTEKRCSKCREVKPAADFPRDKSRTTGLNRWCRQCVRRKDSKPERVEARRAFEHTQKGKARRLAQPEKFKAGDLLRKAVKRGDIVKPDRCSQCAKSPKNRLGKSMIEAHHPDYSKPYDVKWLCRYCHAAEHSRINQLKEKKPWRLLI